MTSGRVWSDLQMVKGRQNRNFAWLLEQVMRGSLVGGTVYPDFVNQHVNLVCTCTSDSFWLRSWHSSTALFFFSLRYFLLLT